MSTTLQKPKSVRKIILSALTEQSVKSPKSLTRKALKDLVAAARPGLPRLDRQVAGRLSELTDDGLVKQTKADLARKDNGMDRWQLVEKDAKTVPTV